MTKKVKYRRQNPIKGGREVNYAGLERRIQAEITYCATKWNCSKSMVIATALADTFGIDLEQKDRYDEKPMHVKKVSEFPKIVSKGKR